MLNAIIFFLFLLDGDRPVVGKAVPSGRMAIALCLFDGK
jgi:hypothetical protein